MARITRKVVAVDVTDGSVIVFDSVYDAMNRIGAKSSAQILQALDRGGCVGKYRLYDTPEQYRNRIAKIEEYIKEVEAMI